MEVLVIDDEMDVRLLCRINLKHAGMLVREAESGRSGLAAAWEAPPDVVILDLMMAGMDGFDVLRTLRSDERTADLPVLVLSALTTESDRARCLLLGANAFMSKPFFPGALTEELTALVHA